MPLPPDLPFGGTATVIGGGPGGLMAAEVLARAGLAVTVYERMPSVGRKLLLAGRGGLNLTHSEPIDDLLTRYDTARPALDAAVRAFDPTDLRDWSRGLGQDTFVGTSGRVFPQSLRATPLLRAWLRRLADLGVQTRVRHEWTGWDSDGAPTFVDPDGAGVTARADVTVLALGGASWPRVGANGAWVETLRRDGIEVADLRPANCGFVVGWTPKFAEKFAGTPLKNVALAHGLRSIRGEAMITSTGIEGGAIYALSRQLRESIDADGTTTLVLDLLPDHAEEDLVRRLDRRRAKDSLSSALKRSIALPKVGVGLLREATANDVPTDSTALARLVKALPLTLVATQPIDRAISSAGGVSLDEVDERFMLRRRPGTFVVGEMLDWEAPTGGYLLQATFSTAVAAATGAQTWLAEPTDRSRLTDAD